MEGQIMVSFDVESLFTTIPVQEALAVVRKRLEEDSLLHKGTSHSIATILELATSCLNNTYFQWKGQFFKQKQGTAMDSPLSPIICNIYLEHIETQAINSFGVTPVLFNRYVDDVFAIWPESECPVLEFLDHLNSQSAETKFTIEHEQENKLPFLDVKVKKLMVAL
jgi:retron-type reverse transcriptase